MAGGIQYICDRNCGVEVIFTKHSAVSYPLHNHVSVFTAGMVLEGAVVLRNGNQTGIFGGNQIFIIPPYMPHSIETAEGCSMLSIPSLDKGTHGRTRVNLRSCIVTFAPRTSGTRRSSALQGHKFISFRLFDPSHRDLPDFPGRR